MTFKNRNIICFGGADWWYHNAYADMHIMKEFAKYNRVLFINSIGTRMPSLKDDPAFYMRIKRKFRSLLKFIKNPQPNIYVYSPFALPFFGSQLVRNINFFLLVAQIKIIQAIYNFHKPIIWASLPTVVDVVKFLNTTIKIYYCFDNIVEFPGVNKETIRLLDKKMLDMCDITFFAGTALFEEKKEYSTSIFHLPHGVDFQHFNSSNRLKSAPEIEDIHSPIVGFTGEVNAALDWKLIGYLAKNNPDISFVFVGGVMVDIGRLKQFKNIFFLGKKDYMDLPKYIKRFDVCIIPYDLSGKFEWYRNPQKLMEYLATGKPVVSVAFPEVQKMEDIVLLASTYQEFSQKIKEALSCDNPPQKEKRLNFARQHTWDHTANIASKIVIQHLAKK